jgi:pseudouridine synthase
MEERLQKVLAAAGVASRRKCEELIAAGRVRVNGEVVTAMGIKVSPQDRIEVDGIPVKRDEAMVYYILNKPAGYITTVRDTHGRPTVMSLVPATTRVFPVGRLDMDTQGLLLLTNDGELANALLHPSAQVDKVYRVTVAGQVREQAIAMLEKGVQLEEGRTAPAKVRVLGYRDGRTRLELTIHEGRKRQVKRMFQAVGHRVLKLERIKFAFLTLSGLERGKYRTLTDEEVQGLKKISGNRGQKRN